MKLRSLNQWAIDAQRSSGMSQAELDRKLAKELRREADRSIFNKIVLGRRKISAEEMLAIERVTQFPAPSTFIPTQVKVIDWVTAGKLSEPSSQAALEDARIMLVSGLGTGDFFALKVSGTSMDRVSPEGSIIIVNQNDKQLIAGFCYVFSNRGETTYKRWHTNPDYLAPYSWDPSHEPIMPQRKKDWEVVGRVKRTLLDL